MPPSHAHTHKLHHHDHLSHSCILILTYLDEKLSLLQKVFVSLSSCCCVIISKQETSKSVLHVTNIYCMDVCTPIYILNCSFSYHPLPLSTYIFLSLAFLLAFLSLHHITRGGMCGESLLFGDLFVSTQDNPCLHLENTS